MQLVESVRALNDQLGEIKTYAESRSIYIEASLDDLRPLDGMTLRHLQSLQSHYFCLLLDVNTPHFYPWLNIAAHTKHDPEALAQIDASCDAAAGAARSVILAARNIRVDASCPAL